MDAFCKLVVCYGALLSSITICHASNIQLANMWTTDNCNIIDTTMTCEDIPKKVPKTVRKVIVKYHHGSLNNRFSGHGWDYVESLDISDGDARSLSNGDLRGLVNLREFSMALKVMGQMSSGVFSDTPNISKLTLRKMNAFDFSTLLVAVSQPGSCENLTELNFDPKADGYLPPRVIILNNVVNRLVERPLVTLKVSNSLILYEVMALIQLFLKVQQMNISGSTLVSTDESLSFHLNYNGNTPLFKMLDISGVKAPYHPWQQVDDNNLLPNDLNFILQNECVYMDHMKFKYNVLVFPNYTSNEKIFIKSLYMRNSAVKNITGRSFFTTNNAAELLDLSGNAIGYIQPALFSTAGQLKYLYLSHNQLNKMQMMPLFSKLTAPLRHLTALYLDANDISLIPWDMFTNNKRLEILNIADNKMTTIAFNLRSLTVLKFLDVSRNSIHYIEGIMLVKLDAFWHERRNNLSFDISFQGNPLQCSCESLTFIKWLVTIDNSIVLEPYLNCSYESSIIDIDQSAVSKCKFLCRRKYIIVCSIASAVFVLTMLGIAIWAIMRAKRRRLAKDRALNFMYAFNNNLLPYDHICFVAYAGKDEETVRDSLLNPLDVLLKAKLNTEEEVIGTGYNFKPGYPIHDEAYRFIKNSPVFIAVVSNAFCESKYCTGEIREACTQQKAVIVVLLETVAEDNMTPYLVEVFRRNARAKMVENDDGKLDVVPNVNVIAESVLALAIDAEEA